MSVTILIVAGVLAINALPIVGQVVAISGLIIWGVGTLVLFYINWRRKKEGEKNFLEQMKYLPTRVVVKPEVKITLAKIQELQLRIDRMQQRVLTT